MTLWACATQWMGDGPVSALVEAESEDEARERGAAVLRDHYEAEAKEADAHNSTNSHYWREQAKSLRNPSRYAITEVERVEIPCVCEWMGTF